ncbi:macro domain-like protein [Rhizophagus irregularis]|nr:macro domain-like protein [Rhizophagus irregularis]
MSFSSMSRRRSYIDLEEIPTLKQAYEERSFSPRNLKRAANLTRKYEHNEEFNKKISLIQADITKLRIDAIVNAANETLLGGGGVDGAIHSAAGPGLRKECWDLNGCDTGDAKITGGHDLPSKHVIHTVGPVGEKPGLLRSAYVRSMNVMCENNLKSIAFSNISTGVYGYPRGKAGQLALDTIRKWLEENSEYFDKLDRIIFCVFEDENKDVYETLLPLYFPPSVDIDNYVKEEEKPKTNEEKKGNEAGKDKDQEKTHTSLTTEQVNNKEIIGTDNDKGVKEKIEEKDHETLTTGKEPLSVDENKEVKKEKDHETSTTGQANDEGPLKY